VVVDLPLVPVMATKGASRARRPLAAEQLDVADDLEAGRLRPLHCPMRDGVGQRHAGRQNQRGEGRPVGLAQVRGVDALGGRPGHAVGIVVAGNHGRTAGLQAEGGGETRAPQTKQGDGSAGKGGDRNHQRLGIARSFGVFPSLYRIPS
jgi:hypothetical protein